MWSFISALLTKSGNIGKVSSAEPLFAGLFARLLVEIEPKLADCFAIVWWKGGDEERETCILEQSDVVVGYGGNASLQSLQSRTPITTRFLAYGHKISFGLISRFSLDSQKLLKLHVKRHLMSSAMISKAATLPIFLCPTWRQCFAKRICEISGT